MFFQIVFEGIKFASAFEYVQGFISKRWTNVKQSKLSVTTILAKIYETNFSVSVK